jgi:hypothetical protein
VLDKYLTARIADQGDFVKKIGDKGIGERELRKT